MTKKQISYFPFYWLFNNWVYNPLYTLNHQAFFIAQISRAPASQSYRDPAQKSGSSVGFFFFRLPRLKGISPGLQITLQARVLLMLQKYRPSAVENMGKYMDRDIPLLAGFQKCSCTLGGAGFPSINCRNESKRNPGSQYS